MTRTLLLSMITLGFMSCVNTEDFELPDLNFEEPILDGNLRSIASVKGAIMGNSLGIVTFNTPDFMEGYVVSSDEGGNFFEEVVLQDAPENPTAGIIVQIDVNPLFTRLPLGQKVYVKLNGLTGTTVSGTIQLGIRNGAGLTKIPSSLYNDQILRSREIATLVPKSITFLDFNNAIENLYVQLNNWQFTAQDVLGEKRKTFASEGTDQFDGERVLQNCGNPVTFTFSTSTFSDFKASILPSGSGRITGILQRNFGDDYYILSVNGPLDLDMNGPRCDAPMVSCGLASAEGNTILFTEDFQKLARNKPVTGKGWTNFAETGNLRWTTYVATGANASLGVSAHLVSSGSGDESNINWLITPAIDLQINPSARLRFQSSTSLSDNSVLEVLVSMDWDGKPSTVTMASWSILSDAYVAQNSDFFGEWINSGVVDLGCLSGNVHVAFKYTGSGRDNFNGIQELDNVRITTD